ncbi:hypothetical protein [Colwellia psychrerythraea]|uniref:Uncharacterized protein n=1 Tax=Colwellia psychrerythraea TaxID=28229 RepID=A0A099KFK7_COLPS|nr:hypothetical protein [Colwellia psychrerythraea]KGJ88792.1 hypothetical protein ND2E_3873 [Colwellia psychrerythraea]
MKYLPSFIFGIILTVLLLYVFHFSAVYSPILDFITSTPDLDEHSFIWIFLMVHDSLLALVFSALILFLYRHFLPKLPFNWLAILLMQIPLTFFMFRSSAVSLNFDTVYNAATSIASLVYYISVLVVFSVTVTYNKQINQDK